MSQDFMTSQDRMRESDSYDRTRLDGWKASQDKMRESGPHDRTRLEGWVKTLWQCKTRWESRVLNKMYNDVDQPPSWRSLCQISYSERIGLDRIDSLICWYIVKRNPKFENQNRNQNPNWKPKMRQDERVRSSIQFVMLKIDDKIIFRMS